MWSQRRDIKLPDDVLALLTKQAENEGVSLDEAAAVAIRIGLEEGRWRRLLAAGRTYGSESGYTEDDVESIIKGFRHESRGKQLFKVTADTNIYVSALNFGGKPQELLELARAGKVELAISNAIITEVARILYDKFGWDANDVTEAVDIILGFAKYLHPDRRLDVVAADPDDNRVPECPAFTGSQVIVTGTRTC